MATEGGSRITAYVVAIALIAALSCAAYFIYKSMTLDRALEALTEVHNTLLEQNSASTEALEAASTTIAALSDELSLTAEELEELEDDYRKERNRNEEFEDQISDIAGTVSDLDKLSKTDEELLQKYSKVYFLNEHYIPEQIVEIEKEYLYNEDLTRSAHAKVEPYLTEMLDDALDDGVKIWIVSSYRSFGEQASLKGNYTITYGSGANAFSADQGYSEHQLGTTFDFTTEGMQGGLTTAFENTPAFAWLQKNAHKYGFTLSYPEDNAYYMYEPWHWRFVGEDLAEDLEEENAHFYDWDQREIDKYLIKIFD